MFWPMKRANTGNFQFMPFTGRSFSLQFPFFGYSRHVVILTNCLAEVSQRMVLEKHSINIYYN